MQEKPLLSISILVSNRIDTIRNCMESIKPMLEGFPCELIAVDTVGEKTDGSIDVVREYTDKIYYFEWCNDFAKARNFGLEKCSGEWFMFMDDDEWFEDVTEIIEFFMSGEYKNYNCANYKIRNYGKEEGTFSIATLLRMAVRTPNLRFEGRIHEYLKPMNIPAKEFSAYVHHYGYAFKTKEEELAHCERNIGLLEPEFKKNPWDMHVRVQLVQEYLFLKELQGKALKLCEETLKADKKYYKTNEFQWILLAYIRLANKEKNWEEVIERAEKIRARFPLSATADLAISTLEISVRSRLEQYEKGYAILEHAIKRRQYLLDNEQMKQQLLLLDFATFLEDSTYCDLLKFGIRCALNIGKKERAAELAAERFKYMKNPALTISILVSNRKDTIRKCLDSIQPLLNAIPSELIIVDTVGDENSDGSLSIAKEYTNHIVPFVWCDDFAAARNAGLQAAKGEWFLYLDDDEWFENIEEVIRFFTSGEYLEYNSATYLIRNYKDKQGTMYSDEVAGRMIHRAKNSTFIGCINETFSELYLPHKAFSAYVHHYGFAYATPEEKQARMQYTQKLLQMDLERYPENLRNRAQLAAVLSVKDPKAAVELCVNTLEICKEKKENSQYQWQSVVLFGLYESLQMANAAEAEYRKLTEEDLLLPVAEQVVCYRMTRICIMQGEYAKAYPYAKRYFDLAEAVVTAEIPKEFEKYQDNSCAAEMLTLGSFCAWQAKAYADAWSFYEAMSWETLDASAEDTMWKLFAMAEENADADVLFRIIKRMMTNGALKPVLGKLMQSNPLVKQRVNATLAAQRTKQQTDTAAPEKIKLSIGILVSNRIDTIRKCMESLKPLLNAVPCELIALDTVGEATDGSAAVVREYTDKVYCYEWCNDFADARNACLSRAAGEWFMYLDDDEWFENVEEIIAFFNSGEDKNYNSATYQIRNYKDLEGREYSMAVLGRMVRKTDKLRFVGSVHESFSEFALPCKDFSAYVHHFGYAYADEQEKMEHVQRNLTLIEEELAKNPKDMHYRTQMAMELANFDNERALRFCEETLALCQEQKNSPLFQWQLALIFRLYEALGTECATAEENYRELKNKFGFSETAENAICYQMTRICILNGDYVKAFGYVTTYFETLMFLEEHPDMAQLQMAADFARYRAENCYAEMLEFGAFCAWQAKSYTDAWNFYACMAWETLDASAEDAMWKVFAMAEECVDEDALFHIIKRIMTNDKLKPVLGKLMQSNALIKQRINNTLAAQRAKQ